MSTALPFSATAFLPADAIALARRPLLGVPLLARCVQRLHADGAVDVTVVSDADGDALRAAMGCPRKAAGLSVRRDGAAGPGPLPRLFVYGDRLTLTGLSAGLVDAARRANAPAAAFDGEGRAVAVALPASLSAPGGTADPASVVERLRATGTPIVASDDDGFLPPPAAGAPRRATEDMLLAEQRRSASIDGVLGAHVWRPLSLALTRHLMRLPGARRLSANHVTGIALVTALAGAGAMASGAGVGFLLGVLLLQVSDVIHGIDGDVARLRGEQSEDGAWFGALSHDLARAAFLLGSGVGVSRYLGASWPLWTALAAIAALAVACRLTYRRPPADPVALADPAPPRPGRAGWLAFLLKRDVGIAVFAVLVLAGVPEGIPIAGLALAIGLLVTVATRQGGEAAAA